MKKLTVLDPRLIEHLAGTVPYRYALNTTLGCFQFRLFLCGPCMGVRYIESLMSCHLLLNLLHEFANECNKFSNK